MIYLKSSVGIEIRGNDLIISALRSNFSGSVFTGFAKIADYRSRDREEVRQELARFFKSQRLNRDNLVLGIPRGDVVIRHLDLPREVEDNLKQVVQYQVQTFEPSESERSCYDYAPLKPADKDKRLRVLLVLARKTILDGHLQTLRELDIRPVLVSVGPAALANMFLGSLNGKGSRTFALADVKPGGLETMLVRNGSLAYSREAAKEQDEEWGVLLRREIELAVSRARLNPDEAIDSLVLSGEGSETVYEEIREQIPGVQLIGDLVRFEMAPENRSRLQQAGVSLGLAFTGMTRRPPLRINLLPGELRIRQSSWAYVPTAVLGLAALVLLIGLGTHRLIQERVVIRELDAQIEALRPDVERVQRVRSQTQGLEKRINFIESLFRRKDMNLEILQELTNILPTDTFLNIYRNQDCSIQIAGSSASAEALIPALERSPLIANVVQRGTTYKDPNTGKDRFNFEAKCER